MPKWLFVNAARDLFFVFVFFPGGGASGVKTCRDYTHGLFVGSIP